ncbi:hypothetical protein BGX30_003649, partial [Mortierella sp. GBA39]
FFFQDKRVSKRVANLNKIQKEWAVKILHADAKANALIAGYTNRFGRSPGTPIGFTSCYGFVGNKIIYGITILRQLVLELLAETKEFREQWQAILDGLVERNS